MATADPWRLYLAWRSLRLLTAVAALNHYGNPRGWPRRIHGGSTPFVFGSSLPHFPSPSSLPSRGA